jgi:GT2 family glycosyltransferase
VTEAPPATVLICTRGRGELVLDCVRAARAALREADELLVVEAGGDSSRAAIEALEDPCCRWLAASRAGKCRQLNEGIRAARGEVVAITDDDCIVAPGWVEAMARPFLERGVGIAFGPVRGLSSTPASKPTSPPPSGPATAEAWVHAHGAAMAISRRAALDVGGFDERFGPGTQIGAGEEADLLARLEAAGWRAWTADAPVVDHVEWRTAQQELKNALAYERGGGAWVGAALRRGPLLARRRIELRLRYQVGHFRSGASRWFAARALLAFAAGVVAGLRLAPRRFLAAPARPTPALAAAPPSIGHALPGLPLPVVRGRRCLVVGDASGALADDLEQRGAAEVVRGNPPPNGRFDLVVALAVLDSGATPSTELQRLRELCREGSLLSIEPLSLPLARAGGLSAADHRALLLASGFDISNVSRIFVVHDPGRAARLWPARALQRALTGDPAPGRAHRAILAVPTR